MYNQNDCYKLAEDTKRMLVLTKASTDVTVIESRTLDILETYPEAFQMLVSIGEPDLAEFFRTTDRKITIKQIGGDHYNMPIQPIEFITKNNLGYCAGNVVKYVSRYKNKNGVEDLEKAKHYLEILIAMGGE